MKRHLFALMFGSVLLALGGFIPVAYGAKSPAMESCTAEWKKMKEAGTIPSGQTWPKFWSQCAKDYAAANPGQAGGEQNKLALPPESATKAASTKTAVVDESNSVGSGPQKKQC